MSIYDTRVRTRGDIGRVTECVVYGGFDICVYMYIHMWVSAYACGNWWRLCIYETRVRSRGDIDRVTASVWCMAVLKYVYMCIYICMYLYIYVGVGGDCAYMRLEYEVEGTSAA